MSRAQSRELAMQALYALDVRKGDAALDVDGVLTATLAATNDKPAGCKRYAAELVSGARARQDDLDATLAQTSRKWKLSRMSAVDRAILRLGLYEMRFVDGVDEAVVINEMVELAKRFSGEQSPKFINGILGALVSAKDSES